MIPHALKNFVDNDGNPVTFGDLTWPEDRRRRAETLLEKFDFDDVAIAFAKNMGTGGCWRIIKPSVTLKALPYKLAEFCSTWNVHTREIAMNHWSEIYIHGSTPEESAERASGLKYFIEDNEPCKNNEFEVFSNYRLFERLDEYYPSKTYQKPDENLFLVFADPSIMSHLKQTEITSIGWALWKYANNEDTLFGFHPTWAFEPKRNYSFTQGSGYEYVIRYLPDPHASGHIRLTFPAFIFYIQEEALKFRTMLDMLGFYNAESKQYAPLTPVPIFHQTTSNGNGSRFDIRAANYVVV